MQWDLIRLDTVDSTNTYAKNLAINGAGEGTAIIAELQEKGRGRLGRSWASAPRKGIWMSVILKPEIPPREMLIITQAAAVAIVDALAETTGIEAFIKWPNDIMLSDKKLCGILTEMSAEPETVKYVVLGIGLNVFQEMADFPEDIRNKAISLHMFQKMCNNDIINNLVTDIDRDKLIFSILMNIEIQYSRIIKGQRDEILDDWCKHSMMPGKTVEFTSGNGSILGTVKGISGTGSLEVISGNGDFYEITSGEVRIKGND